MCEGTLQKARNQATKIRFSVDNVLKPKADLSQLDRERNYLYNNRLSISESVTPLLADSLKEVLETLSIPQTSVDAFVFSSPEVQAECLCGSELKCIIQFSSGLIELLDEEEFKFVVGHELGHFLFLHVTLKQKEQGVEQYMQYRAQEISSDRIGLISCQSLDVAIRALMKTASGLSKRHLRFDVGGFISQLSEEGALGNEKATHPSLLIRCRALLWFSANDYVNRGSQHYNATEMDLLDRRIDRDLERYVDGPVRARIAEATDNLLLWATVWEIVQDGVFEKREQGIVEENFGIRELDQIRNFLSQVSTSEILRTVSEKLNRAKIELQELIPESYKSKLNEIDARISLLFPKTSTKDNLNLPRKSGHNEKVIL
jgi:hypothetical protein